MLRHPDERHPDARSRDLPGTPWHNHGPHGTDRTALNTTRPQPGDGVSVFLCNFLDDHGVQPVKVLKKAGLRHETQADWHSGDAGLFSWFSLSLRYSSGFTRDGSSLTTSLRYQDLRFFVIS
jgi:hypothetical protein